MPTNPAGEEFAKLGQDVIAETGKVQQALENMLKAAGEADKVTDELANTQKESGKIAKQYSDALKNVEERTTTIAKVGSNAAKQTKVISSGLSTANRMTAGLSKSFAGLGRSGMAAQSGIAGVGVASREAAGQVYDLRREADMTAEALSSIKGNIDLGNISRSVKEVEDIASKLSNVGLNLKVELDTTELNSSSIDKFVEKIDKSSDLKIKITTDVSGLSTDAIDDLTNKMKAISEMDMSLTPFKMEVDTSDLEAARKVVGEIGNLEQKIELFIDTSSVGVAEVALKNLSEFDLCLDFSFCSGLSDIEDMRRELDELRDMDSSTTFTADMDTHAIIDSLDKVNKEIKKLQKNADRMDKALSNIDFEIDLPTLQQEVEVKIEVEGEDLQESLSADTTKVEAEIEKAIFKLKLLREEAELSGASLEVLGEMDLKIAKADVAKDFVDDMDKATQAGITLDSAINTLSTDVSIWGLRMAKAAKEAQDSMNSDIVRKALDDQSESLERVAKAAKYAAEAGGDIDISVRAEANLAEFEIITDYLKDLPTDAARAAAITNGALSKIGIPKEVIDRAERASAALFNEQASKNFGKELGGVIGKYEEFIEKVDSGATKVRSLEDKRIYVEAKVELGELENFENILRDIDIPELKVGLEGMDPAMAKEFVKELSNMSDAQLDAYRQSQNMTTSLDELRKTVDMSASSLQNAAAAAREHAMSASTFRGEIAAQNNILDIFVEKLNDGTDDAHRFAGGIGATEGKMIGAGVAAFFLLQKLGDLVDEFQDARMEIGQLNISLDAMERTTIGALPGEFDRLTESLYVSDETAEQFFRTLKDGANSGVSSVAELASAAAQLRETFGGEQIDRLEEYVDLLKEIPTLEQDLQIGADLDDQAAAIFALAQAGKIETLVDLQAAGLAGGIQVEATDDVKLLNAAQKTAKIVDNLHDSLITNFFPAWGPQFGAIASNTFAALGMLGGGVAALGTLRVFFGHGQKALGKKQDETTDAINGMKNKLSDDMADMDSGSDDASKIEKGFKRALKTELARRLKGLKGNVFRRGTGRAATRVGARLGGMQGARAVQAGGGGAQGLIKALPQLTRSIYETQGGMRGMARTTGVLIKDSAGLAKSYLTSAATVTNIAGKMSTAGTTIASAGVSVVKGIGAFAKTGGGVTLIAAVAGIALDKFANVIGDSTKETGPALMKFAGGLLSAVGTIGGLAFVGSSAGPVGTALGALAGVALVATGPIEDLGVSLQQTVTDVRGVKFNRFAPWLVDAGIKLEAFSGGVKELVKGGLDNLKEAITGSAEAIHGLAIGAGEFIMMTPGVRDLVNTLSDAKDNLSKWYDSLELITSVESRDIKKQEEEESARVARKLAQLGQVTEKLTKLQQERQTGLMKSAQALEQQLGRTEAIFNGATFALKDFNTELGQSRLDVLTEVGGNLGMFNAAVSSTTDALKQKFGAVSKTLDRERASIIRNGDLNASMREQALNVLHMKELEAVADFAQGLDSLIDRILEAPEIMIKGIEEEIRSADFDFALEGGVGLDQFFEGSQEGLDNVNKSVDLTFQQWEAAAGELASASQALKSETKEAKKAVGEIMPTLIEELKKADLGDVAEGFSKVVKTEKGEDGSVTVTDIDTTEAVNFMEKLNSQIEGLKTKEQELNDQLKGLNIDAATASFTKAKEDTVDANKKIEDWKESLSDLNDDLDGAVGDERLTLLKKQKEMVAEQSKEEARVEAATKAQAEITARVNKYVKSQGGSAEVAALYLARISKSKDMSAEEDAKISAFIDSIKKESQKQVGLLEGEVKTNKAKLDAALKVKGSMDGVTSAVGKQVEAIKQEQKMADAARDASEAVARKIQEINRAMEATTKDEERRVQLAQLAAANAAASGDGIAAAAALEERNAELAQAQFAAASRALPMFQANADAQAKKAKLAEESSKAAEVEAKAADEAVAIAEAALKAAKGDAAIKSAEEALSDAKVAAATLKATVDIRKKASEYETSISNQALNAAGEVASDAAEAKRAILDSITQVQDGMSSFEDGLSGRDITANLDLGDALMDAANFSDDFAKATSEAFDITLKAAQREAEFKRNEAAAGTKRAKDALKIELARLRAGGASQEVVGQAKAEGESLIAAKDRARLANIEKDQKQKVVDAARKEASIANENVDIRQSVIDAEMDYLSEVGGNLDSFVSLQNQSVALEAEKLAIAEKELAAAKKGKASGKELLQLEANVRIQGFALKKKEMGLQKSIYDNIVGQAFGGIRSSIGARSRRMGQTTLGGGAAKTQVVTRSGMLSGAGPGGVKTIDQRNAGLKLASDEAKAKFARLGAGGVEGNAPTKGVEEELFGATEKNRETNEKAQKNIAKQTDAMLKKGSIFTHDDGVQSRLDKLISLQGQMVAGIGELLGSFAMFSSDTAGGELIDALAPSVNMQKEQLALSKAELNLAMKSGVTEASIQRLQADLAIKELALTKTMATEQASAQNTNLSSEIKKLSDSTDNANPEDRSNAGERVQKAIESADIERASESKEMLKAYGGLLLEFSVFGVAMKGVKAALDSSGISEIVEAGNVDQEDLGQAADRTDIAGALERMGRDETSTKRELAGRAKKEAIKQETLQKKDVKAQQGVKEQVSESGDQQATASCNGVSLCKEAKREEKQQKVEVVRTERTKRTEAVKDKADSTHLNDMSLDDDDQNKIISKMSPEKREEGFINFLDSMKGMPGGAAEAERTIETLKESMMATGTEMSPAIEKKISELKKVAEDGVSKTSEVVKATKSPSADEVASKSRFDMSVVTPEERAKGIAIGIRQAAAGSLTASAPAGDGGSSGFGGPSSFGTDFKSLGGQTAKDIAAAANAARAKSTGEAKGDIGKLTGKFDEFGRAETQEMAIGRLLEEQANKPIEKFLGNAEASAKSEAFGADKESFDIDAMTGVVSKITETPFGKMTKVLEGKEADAAMTAMGFKEATASELLQAENDFIRDEASIRPEDFAVSDDATDSEERKSNRFVMKMDDATDSEERKSNRFVMKMDDAGEEIAGKLPGTTTTTTATTSATTTTTGGESLAESESLTGVETANTEVSEPGAPGIAAKATPNQEVIAQPSNRALADKQQGMNKFDQNPRFQAAEMSNVGNARTGVAELPVMKVEGTMRVEFNNAVFKGTIATMVGEVINTAEIVDKLTPALKSRGFLNKAT